MLHVECTKNHVQPDDVHGPHEIRTVIAGRLCDASKALYVYYLEYRYEHKSYQHKILAGKVVEMFDNTKCMACNICPS